VDGLGYNKTRVFHSLYLPPSWSIASSREVRSSLAKRKKGKGKGKGKILWPVIVEYSGNGILPQDDGNWTSNGWGISQGKGFILVVLPFISAASSEAATKSNRLSACNQRWWWGCSPEACDLYNDRGCLPSTPAYFDPAPTVEYAIAAVKMVIEKYHGDPNRILLTGTGSTNRIQHIGHARHAKKKPVQDLCHSPAYRAQPWIPGGKFYWSPQ
jgi:hypothetical protein